MKKILITLFTMLPLTLFSQVDSTEIHYKSIENNDLKTICNLTDIQIIKITSKDTLLKNKVFNLVINEFKNGEIIMEDDLKITGENKKIPMEINGKKAYYTLNMMEKVGFGENTDSLTITFAGIFKNDHFKLNIRYPGISFNKELKGKNNYQLREANSCGDNSIKIPVNNKFPVLAYTPPVKTNSKFQHYCLLGEEKIEEWYEKFKIKHYYVIYIEVK